MGGHELLSEDTAASQHSGDGLSTLVGSATDLADDAAPSRLDRVLQWVPRVLSSKPHVMVLMGLGVYLVVLPLLGVRVGANAELIGGNYTNVTSDIGACIAAGGTLHLVSQSGKRRRVEEERLKLARETHRLLHYVCSDAARQLGHLGVIGGHGTGRPPFGGEAGPVLDMRLPQGTSTGAAR